MIGSVALPGCLSLSPLELSMQKECLGGAAQGDRKRLGLGSVAVSVWSPRTSGLCPHSASINCVNLSKSFALS